MNQELFKLITSAIIRFSKLNGRFIAALILTAVFFMSLLGQVQIERFLEGKVAIAMAALIVGAVHFLIGINVDKTKEGVDRINGDVAALTKRIGHLVIEIDALNISINDMGKKLEQCEGNRILLTRRNELLEDEIKLLKNEKSN